MVWLVVGGWGCLVHQDRVGGVVPSRLRGNNGCFVSPLSGDGFVGGFPVYPNVRVFLYGVLGGGWVGLVG